MEKSDIISNIGKKISESILNQAEYDIKPDEALISSGLIDSFSLVDLALLIEEAYGVRIEDYELNVATFDTMEQLADLIMKKKNGK